MAATTADVIRLARLARSFLTPGNRLTDGSPHLYFRDGAPPWVAELAVNAFGPDLPNDHSYQFVSDALDELADMPPDADPHDRRPDLDSLYPYTADRLRWLASSLDRPGFCDEAATEYGYSPMTGRGFVLPREHASLCVALVSMGMQYELDCVYRDVLAAVGRRAELEADGEGETD